MAIVFSSYPTVNLMREKLGETRSLCPECMRTIPAVKKAGNDYLIVSTMAFQDAWNVDTERLRDCCTHTVTPDRKLIPICLFNINGSDGRTFYRREIWSKFVLKQG